VHERVRVDRPLRKVPPEQPATLRLPGLALQRLEQRRFLGRHLCVCVEEFPGVGREPLFGERARSEQMAELMHVHVARGEAAVEESNPSLLPRRRRLLGLVQVLQPVCLRHRRRRGLERGAMGLALRGEHRVRLPQLVLEVGQPYLKVPTSRGASRGRGRALPGAWARGEAAHRTRNELILLRPGGDSARLLSKVEC